MAERNLGRVLIGETGIYIRHDPDRVRAADIAFVPSDRVAGTPGKGFLNVAPALVAEIMSPTDRWQDVRAKIADYFSIGVDRVWVVEPDNRAVLMYASTTEVQILAEDDVLHGDGDLEGLAIPVKRLFQT